MYKLTEISASGSGEMLLLKIECEGEAQCLAVSAETYHALGLKKGELDARTFRALSERSAYEAALIKGMRILGCGANSKKNLERKLIAGGVSRTNARAVAEELSRRGYIDESEDAARLAESLIKRGYGPRRILPELRKKGFGETAVDAAAELLGEYDFYPACVDAMRKKCRDLIKKDAALMKKAIARGVYLGYNVDMARAAFRALLAEAESSEE